MNKMIRLSLAGVTVLLAGSFYQVQAQGQAGGYTPGDYRATLDRYCVTCHNEMLKTAGLMLDQVNIHDLSESPQIWERVITKLSLRAMPPVGMPRPDESFYQSITSYLKSGLNRRAEAKPNPGRSVTAHRLNRNEYTNAIRDLVGVEIDGAAMLPPDNSGGFDNLGELLSVSQVLMEKYMSAAREISQLAVGDTSLSVDSRQYTIDPKLLQHERMSEDLPFGTRGGIAVQHRFPLDGEYVMNIRLQRTDDTGLVIGLDEPKRIDVRVDGERVRLFTIGGDNVGLAMGSGRADKVPPDFDQAQYERTADAELEVRFPMQAGTRTVQVAFLEEEFAWEAPLPPKSYDNYSKARIKEAYERAWTEPSVSNITITGAYDALGTGSTASRDKIFSCIPDSKSGETPCAREILSDLARYGYRRPVSEDDIAPLLDLYHKGREQEGSFEAGIQMALEGLLVSTEFLFRIERDPVDTEPGSVYPVSDLELASRLSFFLWSSIPDGELLRVAEQGRLDQPEVLREQVIRMLEDERSRSLVDSFAEQWLLLRNLPQAHKNQEVFPEFDENLRQSLYQEVKLFIGSIFEENRSILDILRADYSFLNERLARHYGVNDVYGNRFRKVAMVEDQQGLLARAGILSITSYPNRNSTVLRGKWVLENILASPPPPPPPDIPPLEDTQGAPGETLTLRERMERHPANPVCAVCHNQMDPIGFGLENYNAIGQWRTEEAGKPINASGRLPSGVEFEGPKELQAALLDNPEVFASAFTQKLLTYALGRPLEYYDMPAVRRIVNHAEDEDYRFSSIVTGIVNSTPFQMRRAAQ